MDITNSPKITIIVPVYNAEAYLQKCIESIVNQIFGDFECLLIDDGSTDKSGIILDEIARQDSRFKVVHKDNGGVSSARNVGLEIASGEYITFIDADDFVSKSYLKNLYEGFKADVDLSVSFSIYTDGKSHRKDCYEAAIVDRENFSSLFTNYGFAWHTSPWAKMYKKAIIKKEILRFDNKLLIGEDLCFLYSYILLSRRIFLSSETDYYYYYTHSGSLTKQINALDVEKYTYSKISFLVRKVISVLDLNTSASEEIMWVCASFCRRVLNALYSNNVVRDMRLSTLNTIDVESYCKYIKPSSIKEKIYAAFLKYKCYKTYDNIRSLVKIAKKWTTLPS